MDAAGRRGADDAHLQARQPPGLEDQDVTEVVSMRTAADLVLPTAHAIIADFAGERVIAVERYDRLFAQGRWWRIHQEELCQATGG